MMDKNYLDSLEKKIELFREEIPNEVRDWEADPEKRYLLEVINSAGSPG